MKYFIIILAVLLMVFIFRIIRKWRRYYKIIRFREKLKPGDYCHFTINNKTETGFVIRAWKNLNIIHVNHLGITHKLKYHDVFP